MIKHSLCKSFLVLVVCISFVRKYEAKPTEDLLSELKLNLETEIKGKSNLELQSDLIKPVYEKSENETSNVPLMRNGRNFQRLAEMAYRKRLEIKRKVVRNFILDCLCAK